MRDLVLTAIIGLLLVMAFTRPWIGVLTCLWLGYMNPHRLTYGFAFSLPFFAVAAGITFCAILLSREPKVPPLSRELILLILFIVFMTGTTLIAMNPEEAWVKWERTIKTLVMVILAMALMTSKERLGQVIWVIAVSIGIFGVKGGLFAIATAGSYRVHGPPDTMLENNNALAIVLAATIPWIRWLQLNTQHKVIRMALGGAIGLSALSVLASYSRGGFVALCVCMVLLWMKSRQKILVGAATVILIPLILAVMPNQWFDRMNTIQNYEGDSSSMGRMNAWKFATNIALERPFTGGGFRVFSPELFLKYAPDPEDHHDAHSIYFEVLGEHGFTGIIIFVALGVSAWRTSSWIKAQSRYDERLQWAADLGLMGQVSLAAFAVGGATSTLGYYDLPYHVVAMIAMCRHVVERQLTESSDMPGELESVGVPGYDEVTNT